MDLMETRTLVIGAVVVVHLVLVAIVGASAVVALASFGVVVAGVQAVKRGKASLRAAEEPQAAPIPMSGESRPHPNELLVPSACRARPAPTVHTDGRTQRQWRRHDQAPPGHGSGNHGPRPGHP